MPAGVNNRLSVGQAEAEIDQIKPHPKRELVVDGDGAGEGNHGGEDYRGGPAFDR